MITLDPPLKISTIEEVRSWVILEIDNAKDLFIPNRYYHLWFSSRWYEKGEVEGVIHHTKNGFKKILSPFRALHLHNCNYVSSLCIDLYVELVAASDKDYLSLLEVIGYEKIIKKDMPLFINWPYKSPAYIV
jgi:hypothetical protein